MKRNQDNETYENTIEILRQQLSAKADELAELEAALADENQAFKLKLDEFRSECCSKEEQLLAAHQQMEELKEIHLNEINQAKLNLI